MGWTHDLVLAVADAIDFLPDWLLVFVLAGFPVLEVRGSIPVGALVFNMPIWWVVALSLLGNLLVLPILWVLLPHIERGLRRSQRLDRGLTWLWARVHNRHSTRIDRYEEAALILLVAVPLPGSGLWTATVAAYVFGLPRHKAWPALALGALVAVLAVAIITQSTGTLL